MPSSFSALLDDLTAAQAIRDANRHHSRRAPTPAPRRSTGNVPSSRPDPDGSLAKALGEAREMVAENALGGLRVGGVVLCRGLAGPFRIIDIDVAAGRAKLRQVRDASNDPAGANFVELERWEPMANIFPAPGFEDAGSGFADSLELTTKLRASEAAVEDIRRRARALVATKRRELSEALAAGEITGLAAAESEILLNSFASRMGL